MTASLALWREVGGEVERIVYKYLCRLLWAVKISTAHLRPAYPQLTSSTHGQAVSAGMCRAAELGAALGMTPAEAPGQIAALAERYGLPTRIPCPMAAYRSAIGLDKKGVGGGISVILLRELGQAEPVPMTKEELLGRIEDVERNIV